MPDSYTHVSCALQTLLCAKQAVASLPCYLAGANGPHPFYFYQFWRRKRHLDLAALAERIHRDSPGKFLLYLLENSITPQQQSYTMGFLTHYTTDCTLHPYISAMGDAGFYQNRLGRMQFETSLDSELFYRNYRSRTVPLYAATPMLLNDDLGQITALLHGAIQSTYGLDVPVVDLADAFHENVQMRKTMISPKGARKLWAQLLAPLRIGRIRAAQLVAQIQPGAQLPYLPEDWENPYSGEVMHLTFDEVLLLAEQTGAACILAAMSYWLGELDGEKMARILGDNNYYTGQPTPPPVAEAPPQNGEAANPSGKEDGPSLKVDTQPPKNKEVSPQKVPPSLATKPTSVAKPGVTNLSVTKLAPPPNGEAANPSGKEDGPSPAKPFTLSLLSKGEKTKTSQSKTTAKKNPPTPALPKSTPAAPVAAPLDASAPLSASLPSGGSPYGSMGPQAFTVITETEEEDG